MDNHIGAELRDVTQHLLAGCRLLVRSRCGFLAEFDTAPDGAPLVQALACSHGDGTPPNLAGLLVHVQPSVLTSGLPRTVTLETDNDPAAILTILPLLANETPIGALGLITDTAFHESETSAPLQSLVQACARLIMERRSLREGRRRHQRLSLSEARLRTILDRVPDGIITLDQDGRIEAFNLTAEHIFGREATDVVGQKIALIIPDLTSAHIADSLRRYLRGEARDGHTARETLGQRRDGAKFPLDILVTQLLFEDSKKYICVVRDVSERKQAEQQLRYTLALQRAMLDSANYSIIGTDPDGTINVFNRAAQRWLGYSEEEVVGKITPKVIHDLDEVVRRAAELTQELGEPVEPGFDAFVAKSRLGMPDENEWTYIRKDGSRFPVMLSVTTRRNEHGEITGYLGVASDITARKRAEQQLRDTLTLQRAILDSANYSIIGTDADGVITLFNRSAQRWLGYSEQEVVGKLTPQVIHIEAEVVKRAAVLSEELGVLVEPGFAAFVAKSRLGAPDENEWTYVRKDGSHFPVSLSVTTLRNEQGNIIGYLGVASDITERKKSERQLMQKTAELKRSNRELNDFAYVTSHDLKAPLRAIANLSRWIEEDLADKLTDESRDQMNMLRGRVNRMERLIEGILEYSRIGRVIDDVEMTDVSQLLREIVDSMALPDGYSVRIGPDMPAFRCVRLRLGQVLMNLISNAIKYRSHDGGYAEVTVRDAGELYEFSVRDDGIGIAPQYHEKVFGIFQTLAPRDKVESTGIGLSLVKKIVEEQGGAIGLESEEGSGSTFRFTWPKKTKE